MTLVRAQAGIEMGRCMECDHDLTVYRDRGAENMGKVYCSNYHCRYNRRRYPEHKQPNAGKAAV